MAEYKIINIILSRFKKTNQNQKWIKDRRSICNTCPFNSLNTSERTFKMKVYKLLSDFYTWLTRAEKEEIGFCNSCGCELYYKTQEKEEKCPKNKWKEWK